MTHLSTPRRFHLTLSLSVVLLVVYSGCSTYQNITGYFNTYYNAKKLFEDATSEVENVPRKYTDSTYFKSYSVGAASQTKFDKVIEKCSKILQSYPQSSWVDDAVLIIGISYIYKGENEGGIRKCQELVDNFPTSGLRRKAKLWIAKANYFMKKEDQTLLITKDLFDEARSEGDNDVLLEMLMLEAQIYFDRHEYAQAAAKYTLATEISGDDKLRTTAQFQLGLTYERLNDPAKAAEAYAGIKRFKPDYSLLFQSRLKYGRMLTASHQYDRALPVLDALFEEKLSAEEQSLADLEIANTQWEKGDSSSAFALYTLIDTTYRRSDASAKSYYQQGLIYEKRYLDFKSANDFYTKAKDEFPSSEITPLAQQKSLMMSNYFKHYENIHKYDSLLTLVLHPEIQQRINDSIKAKQDSLTALLVARADSLRQKSDSSKATLSGQRADSVTAHSPGQHDSLLVKVPSPQNSLRELPGIPDSLSQTLALPPEDEGREIREGGRWGRNGIADSARRSTPSLPGVRKKFASSGKSADSLSLKGTKKDSLNNHNTIARVPAFTADSLRFLLAQNSFELGGLFYLEIQLPDSALRWYSQVVENYSGSLFTPRAIYAMAEIHRTAGDSTTVDSLYKTLLAQYANSEYAEQIRKNLGMDTTGIKQSPDLIAYREAEQLLLDKDIQRSIVKFKEISRLYAPSLLASKSLYTIGWIYENVLVNNDTAAVWYKKLIKEYPSSLYALAVQPKVAVKDDPKALSQYVKVNEIQTVQKETGSRFNAGTRQRNKLAQDEQLQKGRDRNLERDDTEDTTDDNADDDTDTPDDTDDNN